MQPGGAGSPGMSQLLEHLRAQLEDQVAALQQRRQQLRATLQEDVESASLQVQNQYQVLDNLRYEAEVLTEKLMKLRSSRQDIEAELFVLKDKRIRLLDVINKLEDEEMQLVSEVNNIMQHKRNLLKEVPCFEARARASASLAVVQDYLLASVQHLTHPQGGCSAAAAPSWSGTANVQRPSAAWISMPPPAVTLPPAAAAAAAATADKAAAGGGSGVAGATEAVERLQLEAAGSVDAPTPAPPSPSPGPGQQQQLTTSGPSATFTADQLLQMQQMDGGSTGPEGLPTLHEGEPFTSANFSGVTAVDSVEADMRAPGGASRSSSSFTSDANRAAAGGAGAGPSRPGVRDAAGSWSSFNSRGSDSFRSSGSVRSIGTAGPMPGGSGSFTGPTGLLQRCSSDGRGGSGDGLGAAGQQQQQQLQQHQQQQQQHQRAAAVAAATAAGVSAMRPQSQQGLMPPPPPPPPRRSRSLAGQVPSSGSLQLMDQQEPQHLLLQDLPSPSVFMTEVQQSPGPQQYLLVQQQHGQGGQSGDLQMQLPFQLGQHASQQMLLLEQLMPGGVGLTSAGFDPTTPAGSLDMGVSYSPSSLPGGLPGLQGGGVSGLPLSVSSARTSPTDMWMMPGAALMLQQADGGASDKQALQGLPGIMGVGQQMAGISASTSMGSGGAPDTRQLFVQSSSGDLGGSGGGAAGSGGGSMMLLASSDTGGLYQVQPGGPSHQ